MVRIGGRVIHSAYKSPHKDSISTILHHLCVVSTGFGINFPYSELPMQKYKTDIN